MRGSGGMRFSLQEMNEMHACMHVCAVVIAIAVIERESGEGISGVLGIRY